MGLARQLRVLEIASHVQLGEREVDMAADFAGKVNIKPESLEVDAEHLRKL